MLNLRESKEVMENKISKLEELLEIRELKIQSLSRKLNKFDSR